MSDSSTVPPALPSESFYKSIRTYRNSRTFILIAIGLVAASPMLFAITEDLRHGHSPKVFAIFVAACFLLPAFFLLVNCLRNVREPIEIESKGIRWKHNFWYWTQV